MKRVIWHFLSTLIVCSVLTTTAFAQTAKKSYDIFVPEGNTILSYLPISALKTVESLTVSGILFEEDIEIIQKCENLRYLDLSLAFTRESPEKLAEQQVLKEFVQQVVSLRESAGEEMYKNGDINASQYAGNKLAVDAAKSELSKISITEASKDCYLPSGSFAKMKKLETVLLPLKASSIFSNCFSQCPNLKQVSLPPFIKFIGRGAFSDCYQLKTIDLPLSLNDIERGAFDGTQIAYIDLHKCEWKNTDFVAFNSRSRFLIDDRYVEAPPVKKIMLLPQGVKRVLLEHSDGDIICFPASLTQMSGRMMNGTALFASPNPVDEGGIFKCTIYCPKGSITKYYNRYGESNEYKEVDDVYAVRLLYPNIMTATKLEQISKEDLNYKTNSEQLTQKPDFQEIGVDGSNKWVNQQDSLGVKAFHAPIETASTDKEEQTAGAISNQEAKVMPYTVEESQETVTSKVSAAPDLPHFVLKASASTFSFTDVPMYYTVGGGAGLYNVGGSRLGGELGVYFCPGLNTSSLFGFDASLVIRISNRVYPKINVGYFSYNETSNSISATQGLCAGAGLTFVLEGHFCLELGAKYYPEIGVREAEKVLTTPGVTYDYLTIKQVLPGGIVPFISVGWAF